MRLNLERLREHAKAGVSSVAGVSASDDATFRRNTCNGQGVSGVSNPPIQASAETPETPATIQVFQESFNVYAPKTPETPETPKRRMIRSGEQVSPIPAYDLPIPPQDHTFWAEDFSKWEKDRCGRSERYFGGIKALHADFCEWCIAHKTVGCMLETFEALLRSRDFLIAAGLVSELGLKEDLDYFFPRTPAKEAGR